MSLNDRKLLAEIYRLGQMDGAKNVYNSRMPMAAETFLSTKRKLDRKLEEEEVYKKGWNNGYKNR